MKILHVCSSLDPRGGGVAEAVRQFAVALVRAGHHTEVATVDPPGAEWLREFPFAVHALGPSRGSFQYAPSLGEWLRRQRDEFDCVLSHGLWQYHGFAAWRAWREARGKRFVFAHGMLDPWFKRAYPRKHLKKWLYWPWAENRLLRSARAVFFTCEEERRLARESFWLYRTNEAICPLGIEEPPSDAEALARSFHERYPRWRGKRVILFLGRIAPKKGCDLLLRAFEKLAGAHPDAVLLMAGPGDPEYIDELKALVPTAGSAVHWPGMLAGAAKWSALYAAEAFILVSHQENFGIAAVEALACGKPVLISDKVNIWREIVEDRAGFVAPDTFEGAETLLGGWLALSATDRASAGERARQCFEKRFEIDRAAALLVRELRRFGVSEQ